MNTTVSKNPISRVRQNLTQHLPKETSDAGKTCQDLETACDDFVASARSGQTPALDPYSAELSTRQKIQTSERVSDLAEGAQSDFESASGSTSPLRLHQLSESLSRMEHHATDLLSTAVDEKSKLRKSYGIQVAKTIGWMGAVAGSLLLGLVAAPLSVPLVVVSTGMAIRSLAKARTANKELATKQPLINDRIQEQQQVVADSKEYGSLVNAWDGALNSSPNEVFASDSVQGAAATQSSKYPNAQILAHA